MNDICLRPGAIRQAGLILILGAQMTVCANSTFVWKEEVLLHDGQKIIATRTVERGGTGEIGQQAPIKQQNLTFTIPNTSEKVVWEDKFTEDVGGANFLPMQLEIRKNTAYLVAHPMGSVSYVKWGQPNPPYIVFKYEEKLWRRIDLQELPAEFKTPNLIFSSPDIEAKKVGQLVVSAEKIKGLFEGYNQPEYKTIHRAPLDHWKPRLVYSGPKAPHPISPPNTLEGKK